MKIAMIGAGSVVFCKTLMADIMATPALEGSVFALMSRTEPKLRAMEAFGRRMLADNRLKGEVCATLERREALKGADFVVVMIQVGGVEAFETDWRIPLGYGVDQCVGDTLGPGGVFRAQRTIPVLLDIAREMEEVSRPGAIMLQYANPMAANCLALGVDSKVSFVGLCHGVQTTIEQIAQFIDVPKDQIQYTCGGINHMNWFLTLKRDGKDLYPLLDRAMERPEVFKSEKVRGEVFRQFGYFMTETTGHLAEYVPWFRKNQAALDTWCDEPGFGGESGAYYNWCETVARKYEGKNQLDWESTVLGPRSVEYCSYIMEAVATGKPFRFMGNVRNDGYIDNLPADCCVEVPTYADDTGLHPTRVGRLPTACAALCMTNVNVQLIAAEAAIHGDPEMLVRAIALDPLTSAVCTLTQIREMTTQMLEAQRRWLPQFQGKTVRPRPLVSVPRGTKAIELAQDPAQAILKRFIDLATQ